MTKEREVGLTKVYTKQLFSGNGLSGRSGHPVTEELVGTRVIPQRLKLGVVEFAVGKSVTPNLEICPNDGLRGRLSAE